MKTSNNYLFLFLNCGVTLILFLIYSNNVLICNAAPAASGSSKSFYNIWKEQQKAKPSTATNEENTNYDDYLIDEKSTSNDYENELLGEEEEALSGTKTTPRPKVSSTTSAYSAAYDDELYDDTEETLSDSAQSNSFDHVQKLKKQCPIYL
jgi:hypothetical protein